MAKVKSKAKSKTKGIEDRFKDLSEFVEPLITVIWGRSGSGKTTMAATWPKPMLILDVRDKGSESAKSVELKKGDITVMEVNHFDDFEEVYEYLLDNPDKFKTVVIDHMTATQELANNKVMEEENRKRMSQPMFGASAALLKEMIMNYRQLVDLGIYPVFLAQDRTDETETDGDDLIDPEIGPAMTPAIQKFLIASAKIVGRTYISNTVEKVKIDGKPVKRDVVEYRLGIGPNPYYMTKIRKPRGSKAPDSLVNPTFKQLLDITQGKWEEPSDKPKKKKKSKK